MPKVHPNGFQALNTNARVTVAIWNLVRGASKVMIMFLDIGTQRMESNSNVPTKSFGLPGATWGIRKGLEQEDLDDEMSCFGQK